MNAYATEAIGPRIAGTVLDHGSYGRAVVVESGEHAQWGFYVTERDLTGGTPGRIRTHSTHWETARRSVRVIAQ